MITSSDNSHEAAQLEKLRTQLSTDIEAMQQKEASLKEYEQRLRLLVEHSQSNRPPQASNQYFVTSPAADRTELDAEWEKYERAHALLEAARRGLCDDRLAVKDREERVQLRETEVARREAWLKNREQELVALAEAKAREQAVVKPKPTFASSPFLAARNLLSRHS